MFTCIQMSDSKQEPHMGKIMIEHVSVKDGKAVRRGRRRVRGAAWEV
jgi:hypothetical protein